MVTGGASLACLDASAVHRLQAADKLVEPCFFGRRVDAVIMSATGAPEGVDRGQDRMDHRAGHGDLVESGKLADRPELAKGC
jgi:hypothetical protein